MQLGRQIMNLKNLGIGYCAKIFEERVGVNEGIHTTHMYWDK